MLYSNDSYSRPSYLELRERIMECKDDSVRLGMMYQDIICGRESEVCGSGVDGIYAAKGSNTFHVKYLGEIDAVLFANRSAKRKGFFRPCMVPLNPEYEPWTKELYDYSQEIGDDFCFIFGPSWKSSMRVYRREVSKCFKGLYWPRVEYTKSEPRKIKRDDILRESVNQNNRQVALVEMIPGKPRWFTMKDEHTILVPIKVPSKWKPASTHVIRKSKERHLELYHDFNGQQVSIYGGWTYKGKDAGISDALKHYRHDPIINAQDNIDLLIKTAETYFEKLLTPQTGNSENKSYVVK